MVLQEKWEKTQRLIGKMSEIMTRDHYPLARLLQIRGFLMYVVRTYPWINPYMKGLHLTINSWRPFCGPDSFKRQEKELENALVLGLDRDMPCQRAEDNFGEERPHVSLMSRTEDRTEEAPLDVHPVARFPRLRVLDATDGGVRTPKTALQGQAHGCPICDRRRQWQSEGCSGGVPVWIGL